MISRKAWYVTACCRGMVLGWGGSGGVGGDSLCVEVLEDFFGVWWGGVVEAHGCFGDGSVGQTVLCPSRLLRFLVGSTG